MDQSDEYLRRVQFWEGIMSKRFPDKGLPAEWFGGGFPFSFLDIF
jgi:hypothetical protein